MPAARKTEKETPDGYTRMVSPTGYETTVPDAIKDVLLESGYSEK